MFSFGTYAGVLTVHYPCVLSPITLCTSIKSVGLQWLNEIEFFFVAYS